MRLRDCKSVIEVGKWMQSKGFTPSEHSKFGGVHPVHTSTSLHYKDQALDCNDNDVRDDKLPFDNEREALTWLYHKFLTVFGPKGKNVLDECFFNGFGYIKETPTQNHPIGGHEGHCHAGFKVKTWR